MSGALAPLPAAAGATATASLAPVPVSPSPAAPHGPDAVLALLYPYLADADDPRHVPEADRAAALALAAHFRPGCLPPAVQDIAQAHYAAHLLSARALLATGTAPTASGSSTGTTTTVMDAVPAGQITELQEGSVTVRYGEGSAGTVKTGTIAQVTSKGVARTTAAIADAYSSWLSLAQMCGDPGDALTGGVTPGPTAKASRAYALLTGW